MFQHDEGAGGGSGMEFSPETYLRELEASRWFSRIGEPLERDAGVQRLRGWEEWPGPHVPGVDELFWRQQKLYDALLAEAGAARPELLDLWEQIQKLRSAASRVPYDPDQDCYHGSTTAVWTVSWTAGLVGWCRYLQRPVPDDLAEQWRWFQQGFWPAGYAWVDAEGRTGPLLVL